MYPWYHREAGPTASSNMPPIKTETGYSDCMLAIDYQTKKGGGLGWAGGGEGGGEGGKSGSGPAGGGLVHWMSVMAEHMNQAANQESAAAAAAASVHYMWNGASLPEPCGPHTKDDYSWSRQSMIKQGYEAKMTPEQQQHQSNLHKGVSGGGGGEGYGRSESSSASPPAHPASMLIVPTPKPEQHHVVTQNGSGRKYQCKMCPSGQIFNSKSELQLHSQLHMREVKPYKCTQCSKTFANSSYLSQHTRIHLGIKPYRCEICQRKFTQLSHLQQHIRTHTGDKPYKCRHPGCNKAFSQLSNLQSHSRCHQTDKPYKCNSCYKCFADEPSLLEHIPKHKESKHLKTHICQYCGKSYTQETYLTKHMQKHAERTDKRPPIIGIPRVGLDNPHYWPKVSPDTANSLVDVMQQQHHEGYGNGGHHNGLEHLQDGGVPSPLGYHELAGPIKTSSSAFTPIQGVSVPSHHHNHHLGSHQLADHRPAYLSYAFPPAKGFPTSNPLQPPPIDPMPKTSVSNGFPNQLISLHQIRNYAHQPAHSLMATEHLLQGLKEKGQ